MSVNHRNNLHPAWGIFALCCIIQFGGGGILANGLPIFTSYVCVEEGWSVASFSMHLTIQSLVMAAVLPFTGKLISNLKAPVRAAIGAAGALSMVLCGMFTHLWQWYAAAVVRGIAGAFLFMTLLPIVLRRWFVKHAGTVIGLGMACSGIGGAVMTQVGQALIDRLGWRTAITIQGITAAVLIIPALWFLTPSPEQRRLSPYGGQAPAVVLTEQKRQGGSYALLRNPVFFLLVLLMLCLALPIGLSSHFALYAITLGMSPQVGAGLVTCSLLGNVGWKVVHGWLNDRTSPWVTHLTGVLLEIAGFLLLLTRFNTLLLLTGAFLYGNIYSLATVAFSLLVAELLPAEQYEAGYATLTMVMSLASGLSATLTGAVYDTIGTYSPCIWAGLFIQVAVLLLSLLIYRQKKT